MNIFKIITNKYKAKEEYSMKIYFNETCPKCGSDDVITLRNSDGSTYEHCNTCGHNEPS